MKILLVDDSNAISMAVSEMLKEAGHDVVRAVDGQDAVDILKQQNDFSAILLDWNMPNMDGLEFLQYNNENKLTTTPVIMMTTENKPDKIMKALEHGAKEYIMKPFTQDILISKIEATVGKGD